MFAIVWGCLCICMYIQITAPARTTVLSVVGMYVELVTDFY